MADGRKAIGIDLGTTYSVSSNRRKQIQQNKISSVFSVLVFSNMEKLKSLLMIKEIVQHHPMLHLLIVNV